MNNPAEDILITQTGHNLAILPTRLNRRIKKIHHQTSKQNTNTNQAFCGPVYQGKN
jgi:hypothetical protein